jgi:hypothetical protein
MRSLPLCDEGMETVSSLFLLLASSLLIFSTLSQIDKGSENDGDLVELRSYQARSLGETLVLCGNNSINEPVTIQISDSETYRAFFWDSCEFIDLTPGDHSRDDIIEEVLKVTPDGLSAFLYIGPSNSMQKIVQGEYVSWSHSMSNDLVIILYLSVHGGSIDIAGWDL